MPRSRLLILAVLAGAGGCAPAKTDPDTEPLPVVSRQIGVGRASACLMEDGVPVCQEILSHEADNGQTEVPPGTWATMVIGQLNNCFLNDKGEATCVGWTDSGVNDAPSGAWTVISIGYATACGIRPDQTVECWGANPIGQATPPAGLFKRVRQFGDFTCGLHTDGTIACWGHPGADVMSPPVGSYAEIAGEDMNACVLDAAGATTCWGLEEGAVNHPPTGTGYTDLQMGTRHACVRKPDRTLLCWGEYIDRGYLPPTETFAEYSVGIFAACGVKADGVVSCWWCGSDAEDCNWGTSAPFAGG